MEINRIKYLDFLYSSKFRLFSTLLIFLFLSIFDGILLFLTPSILLNSGLSETQMGIIYSTSAIFGIVFDIILAKFLATTHYQRLILYIILIMIAFPLSLFWGSTVEIFLLSMAIWALYCNMWNFSFLDFVAREITLKYHSFALAIVFLFNDSGYLIGNLIGERLNDINYQQILYILAFFPIIMMMLLFISRKKIGQTITKEHESNISLKKEIQITWNITKRIWPLLLIWLVMTTSEALTVLVTPIIDRYTTNFEGYAGIIMAAYYLPTLLSVPIVQPLVNKFGKKRIGVISFIIGSIFFALQGVFEFPVIFIILSFTSAFFYSLFYASIGGAFSDYLSESRSYDNEIQGAKDIVTNLGYLIGPILGGILVEQVNSISLFTYFGIFSILLGIFIWKYIPKSIPMYDRNIA